MSGDRIINRIVIAGNGFDIAHGYDLGFGSFISQLINKTVKACFDDRLEDNPFLMIRKKNNINLTFNPFPGPNKPFEQIKKILTEPKAYEVVKCELYDEIEKHITELGWVDVENSYFKLLHKYVIEEENNLVTQLNSQMEFLSSELRDFINSRYNSKKQPATNNNLANQLTSYIHSDTHIPNPSFFYNDRPDQYLFLNFNYTNLLEKYFLRFDDNQIAKSRYLNIHGVLDGDDLSNGQSMIFGYGDEKDQRYFDFKKNNAKDEAYRLIKSFNYLKSTAYQETIRFLNKAEFQIVIFGHSCGTSDGTLLRTLFNHKNCISVRQYFHEKPSGGDDYFEKSLAISQYFDDQELFRERVLNKVNCEKMVQSPSFNPTSRP